jgi:citrate lyase subunit beta/citryl-CoA lyase
MPEVRPRRSVLYMPGSNPRAHEKGRSLAVDAIILDLEDAVAPEAKVSAREQVVETVQKGGFGQREVAIRVNAAGTEWFERDLTTVVRAQPNAVLVTKVESPEQVFAAERQLRGRPETAGIDIWAMIETPIGVLNAAAIAGFARTEDGHRLRGFVLGTNDLINDTGIKPGHDRAPLLPWLSRVVLAARSSGLFVLDGVHNVFDDAEGFEAECRQGRAFGMDGKTIIHPNQIATANRIFAPEPEEVAEAKSIIEAFERPENLNRGAIALNGRMVERLHARAAARLIALDEAIRNRAQ